MTALIYINAQLVKLLPTVTATVALSVTLICAQSAQAELVISNSIDADGKATMMVSNDSQKELPPAQLGITPARIDEVISLSQNKNLSKLNQSLTLYNYGNKPKAINLSLIDMDESGAVIEPSETTLKPWTLINPTQFNIPAGGYQTVRMSIRLPMGFELGQRKAMLMIEQQIDRSITYDTDGKGVTVELGSRYGMPIYIDVQ